MSILEVKDIVASSLNDYEILMKNNDHLNVNGSFNLGSNAQLKVPVGTTAQRPSPASAGMMRINSDKYTGYYTLEVYDGTTWIDIQKQEGAPATAGAGFVGATAAVTNGLQLWLDVNNSTSYSSGSSWNDLSGNNRNFTWQNTVTYGTDSGAGNAKYIETSGNLAVGPDSNTFGINNDTGFTIIHWAKQISSNSSHSFKFYGGPDPTATNSSSRGIAPHCTWSNTRIYFDIGGCCNANQRLEVDAPSGWNGSWRMVSFRNDESSPRRDIFDGSSSIANRTDAPANLNLTNRAVHIGGSQEYGGNSSNWDAYISEFYVYNRPLSNTEITTIYNATKGKYGIT